MSKSLFCIWSDLIGFLAVVSVNALANILPIAGRNTGQVSDGIPNLFTPAAATFTVWGVIYLALALFVVGRLLFAFYDGDTGHGTGCWFLLSCAANVGWIFAWHHLLFPLSLGLMVLLLFTLIMLYRRLAVGLSDRPWSRKFIHIGISFYLAWISVATIANTAVVLTAADALPGLLSPAGWTALLIAVAGGLGVIFLLRRRDPFAAAVILWAVLGIVIKRNEAGLFPLPIKLACYAVLFLLSAGIVRQVVAGKVY